MEIKRKKTDKNLFSQNIITQWKKKINYKVVLVDAGGINE